MFGIPLSEIRSRISYREFACWMAYFEQELNTPSRTDWYLMQIAREVASVLSKNPTAIKTESFQLKFQSNEKSGVPKDPSEKAKQSKSFWMSFVRALNGRKGS